MKKLLTLAASALLLLLTGTAVRAQAIYDIETAVYLYPDGSAEVYQRWDVDVQSGTEYYIPIDNPGKSYIHDFSVFEDDAEYESDGREWDSSRSRAEKTGRCGILEKGGGNIELCWGLGEYGRHEYILYYVIDNLVLDYGDCDGFHWHFLNDEWSVKPEHAIIVIFDGRKEEEQEEEDDDEEVQEWYWNDKDDYNVQFWSFGMIGESWIEDGDLCFESTEPFQYRSFFSVLVRFEKGLFGELELGEGTFEELKEQALEGSDYGDYDYDDEDDDDFFFYIVVIFLTLVAGVVAVLYAIFCILRRLYWRITKKRYQPSIFGTNKIEGWFRDPPLGGNPTALYSLIQNGDRLAKADSSAFPNLVGAYFLRWIQDGILVAEKDPKKEKRVNLRFVKGEDVTFTDSMEATVYRAAYQAAGSNELLEANEFKDWSYKHESEVIGWPTEAKHSARPIWQNASMEERRHGIEFRNFLSDYTLINERGVPELGLWKQYMILAASLGIADKVAENFEKLYPKVMEEYTRETNLMDMATTYIILSDIRRSSYAMMSSAILRHEEIRAKEAAERRSSGGGGSISFGGGGGGFGGGHGGGTR